MKSKIVFPHAFSRRSLLAGAGAAGVAAAASSFPKPLYAQSGPVKVGLMLPYSGTYAALGSNITDALMLAVDEQGGMLGGRDVEWVRLDDESDPSRAPQNASRLVIGEEVDFLVGTVHSGVQMGILQVVRQEGTMHLIPNAGVHDATGQFCAPHIFRTSFSNAQPAIACGEPAYSDGHRRAVIMSWDYAAGKDATGGFASKFTELGGEIVGEVFVPFPDVEFQAALTEIAGIDPDCVFVFFAGGGAVKFVHDYAAAGLKDSIPLYGSGFLTDGTLEAQGEAATGIKTGLHYADDLTFEKSVWFREAFPEATGRAADVYAVQGYDTGVALTVAAAAVEGDVANQDGMIEALRAHIFDSPRGQWQFGPTQNPLQDFYLRIVRDGINSFERVAEEDLADPVTDACQMA